MANSTMGRSESRAIAHRVGALQFEPIRGNATANLEKARALVRADSGPTPDLIVFPEMGLSGYIWSGPDEIMPHALQCSNPETQAMWVALAAECQAWLVIGHPAYDEATGRLSNRCSLVAPSGVIGHYDKTCLFAEDLTWATPGKLIPPLWDTPVGKISPLICADLDYPEPIESAVERGAELIVLPTAWVGEPAPSATWIIRAREQRVPIVASDLLGNDQGRVFSGGSCVISKYGEILTVNDYEEGLISTDLVIEHSDVTPGMPKEPLVVQVHHMNSGSSSGTPPEIKISIWSGDGSKIPPVPTEQDGVPHFIVLPTASNSAAGNSIESWLLDTQTYATIYDALVVQAWVSSSGGPEEVFFFSPEFGYSYLPPEKPGPTVALVEFKGVLTGILRNRDFDSYRASRAASMCGAHVVLGQGIHTLAAPMGHTGTRAPFLEGLGEEDPTFGHPVRFRAGDANVWVGFCSNTESVPSGIFSPDHVAWPRNESLSKPGSWMTQRCSLDKQDRWGRAVIEKPLVSSRDLAPYSKPFFSLITTDQWRKL